jgi:hypothetical protein
LWTAATLQRELARHSGQFSITRTLRQLVQQLATNAIVISLVAAALWRSTGLGLHPVPDKMLALLADAGVPTALFALGVSLAAYSLKGSFGSMVILMLLKMVVWFVSKPRSRAIFQTRIARSGSVMLRHVRVCGGGTCILAAFSTAQISRSPRGSSANPSPH